MCVKTRSRDSFIKISFHFIHKAAVTSLRSPTEMGNWAVFSSCSLKVNNRKIRKQSPEHKHAYICACSSRWSLCGSAGMEATRLTQKVTVSPPHPGTGLMKSLKKPMSTYWPIHLSSSSSNCLPVGQIKLFHKQRPLTAENETGIWICYFHHSVLESPYSVSA